MTGMESNTFHKLSKSTIAGKVLNPAFLILLYISSERMQCACLTTTTFRYCISHLIRIIKKTRIILTSCFLACIFSMLVPKRLAIPILTNTIIFSSYCLKLRFLRLDSIFLNQFAFSMMRNSVLATCSCPFVQFFAANIC